MTMTIRRASERGHADLGWLDSKHTFSFGEYYDPAHLGFRALRVINDDTVAGGGGFPTHGHGDMEIVSYPLSGSLEHKDSLGTGSVIEPGDVQRMSAGMGVRHSEYNASQTEPVHFLQIWILPAKQHLTPSYEQKHFSLDEKRGVLRLIASSTGEAGSVTVHQDVRIYATVLARDEAVQQTFAAGRHAWVQVARGSALLNGTRLDAGDGAALAEAATLSLVGAGDGDAELLLFDLA